MEQYLSVFQLTAANLRPIAFMHYGIPLMSLVGIGCVMFFGLRGIFKRKTLWLGRLPAKMRTVASSSTVSQTAGQPSGVLAVVLGICYIVVGLALSIILLPLSYYLLVG